jgi:phospholipase C
MKKSLMTLGLLAATLTGPAFANEGAVPAGVPKLDHVFIIMMENHGYAEIIGDPNTPFINAYAKNVNLATNYFAVAHPSLTNYLEIAGGSNFGVLSDNAPDWHNANCQPNLATKKTTNESVSTAICPISGTGTDAATPAIDFTNETSGPPGDFNIDGKQAIPADSKISGKTIADQLVAKGLTWKSYQESLPPSGADKVDNADGAFSNLTNFSKYKPAQKPPITQADLVNLYAVKHNPFAYFASGQTDAGLANTVSFEQLDADLATGKVPNYSLVVPNQCNDQHGRGNAGPLCNEDPNDNGQLSGLNPVLMQLGDVAVKRLITAIHASPVWKTGHTAIVMVWDENDYFPGIKNNVVATVDTNYGVRGKTSNTRYTHFSLLKSVESGFGLPCLNHACDADTAVMADLFAAK